MKKFGNLFCTALLLLIVAPAFSQFSLGVDSGNPVGGDFASGWTMGFGLSARYEAPIMNKLNWTASAGFASFIGKNYLATSSTTGKVYEVSVPSINIVPITGGVKYYFFESNKGLYGAADIGIYIPDHNLGTKVGFAPGVGYRLKNFDFTARYNSVSDLNYFGLRAAYIFAAKK